MRIVPTMLAAGLIGGLGMALYVLIDEREVPRPAQVIDAAYAANATPGAAMAATPPPPTPAALPVADAASGAAVGGPPPGASSSGGSAPAAPPDPGATPRDESAIAARLCASHGRDASGARTLFGHFAMAEVAAADLAPAPAGFGGGNCTQIHRDAAGPLAELYAAARREAPEVGRQMYGLSCFRSIPRQADLYCRADRIATRGYAGQARWVAPPGFSEHATGTSLDFGNRNGNCNLDPCFATTPVGRWLAANAGRFGFRLSFPANNPQGVSYEPWHFRYVGERAAR